MTDLQLGDTAVGIGEKRWGETCESECRVRIDPPVTVSQYADEEREAAVDLVKAKL
jgi:hypothetical protein